MKHIYMPDRRLSVILLSAREHSKVFNVGSSWGMAGNISDATAKALGLSYIDRAEKDEASIWYIMINKKRIRNDTSSDRGEFEMALKTIVHEVTHIVDFYRRERCGSTDELESGAELAEYLFIEAFNHFYKVDVSL